MSRVNMNDYFHTEYNSGKVQHKCFVSLVDTVIHIFV